MICKNRIDILLICFWCGCHSASASSSAAAPIAYNAILALVVVEVVFAFSVGIICIIFSFNLLRALKETPSEQMDRLSIGNLPPSRPTLLGRTTSIGSLHDPSDNSGDRRVSRDDESELDTEEQIPGYQPPSESILETFGNYLLRWW